MDENKRRFGITDLRQSETEVAEFIDEHWGALSRNYPELMDTLIKLSYFMEDDAGSPHSNDFLFFARTHYLQAPYTFWSLFTLWRKGHYLESSILVRYLLEVVVQLRYFQRYPAQLVVHMTPKRGIKLRTMFDEFSPGFYEYYYGNLLSSIAHGKSGPLYFRLDHSQPEVRIRMGCEYDEDAASMVMNQTLVLLFSFFNLFELYFTKNSLSSDLKMQADVADAKRWLENAMKAHKNSFPATVEWYDHVDKLTRI